jgi:hypothetical protein
MGRLLEDSSGVISGNISLRGDVNIKKVGEFMDAPAQRFGTDTGQVERILMGYLQRREMQYRVSFRLHFGTSSCCSKKV